MAVIASIISKFDESGVNKAGDAHDTLGGKLGKFGKVAGAAFAAAGAAAAAYAGKLLVDGVKAAIEDEAAQAKLAKTLQNTTGASKEQISAVEDYITKTTLATGVLDDKLRPSLDRLVRSTGNVTEAQKLQSMALDIAAGTGKDLQAVSEALAKAHDGNFAALKKLGVPLDENIIKTKDFDAAQQALAATFGGQAAEQANTFQGKMARLSAAFGEAKETVGGYVLDALTPLLDIGVNKLIPAFGKMADKIGKDLKPAFSAFSDYFQTVLIPTFKALWDFISDTLIPGISATLKPIISGLATVFGTVATKIEENREKLEPLFTLLGTVASFIAKTVAPAFGKVLGTELKVVATIIGDIIDVVSTLVGWLATAINKVIELGQAIANSPLGKVAGAIGGVISSVFGGGKAVGGYVQSGTTYLVGEAGAELFTPSMSGYIVPNGGSGGGNVVINVSGALDPVSVADQISRILERQNIRLGVA